MNTELTASIVGALSGAATTGILSGPIETLKDEWFLHFGQGPALKAAKLRAQQEKYIQSYIQETANEVSKIPADKLVEPDISIIGPAIDASRFYVTKEEVRNMFAHVISSSMNSDTKDFVHPAFVQFLKEISITDVAVLKLFTGTPKASLPVARLTLQKGTQTMSTTGYLLPKNVQNFSRELISATLDNLVRLNLITLTTLQTKPSFDYSVFLSLPEAKSMQSEYNEQLSTSQELLHQIQTSHGGLEQLESLKQASKALGVTFPADGETAITNLHAVLDKENELKNNFSNISGFTIQTQPGLAQLTSLGQQFFSICLDHQ